MGTETKNTVPFADEPPPRCTWLVAEAFRLEERAAEFDRSGIAAQAAFYHQRASTKISEALALIPKVHPDGPKLEGFANELSIRAMYLKSLGVAPITLPLEDHVGEVTLSMDLSVAPLPEEDTVSTLLAKGGASGSTAPLTEEGYQLINALRNYVEMEAYVKRVVAAEGRRFQNHSEAELTSFVTKCSADQDVKSFAHLQNMLRLATWLELDLDPKMDKLQAAVLLEKEARMLEENNRIEHATQMYQRALGLFQFLYKNDSRMKSAKVKEMVGKRVEDMASSVERLKNGDSVAATS